tara:strand:+ start:1800 stop:1952 length:153 start_codon:yes stop_codon:yes gene_type:complete
MEDLIKPVYLTQREINQALYILEQFQTDYQDESTQDYKDYSTLLQKLLEV